MALALMGGEHEVFPDLDGNAVSGNLGTDNFIFGQGRLDSIRNRASASSECRRRRRWPGTARRALSTAT